MGTTNGRHGHMTFQPIFTFAVSRLSLEDERFHVYANGVEKLELELHFCSLLHNLNMSSYQ